MNLNFDTPTEVDFQEYFPLDSIAKVEVTGLSEAFWKQTSATKILFQTSQQDQTMTLRVTSKKGVTYTYELSLVTKPAELAIANVDTNLTVTGTVSQDTTLPLTIQSFINKKVWTLTSPISVKDKAFTTSLATISPEWSVSYANAPAFSLKRDTGILTSNAGITLSPDVKVGSPLALKTLLNQKEIAHVIYQADALVFQQVAPGDSQNKNTLGLTSSSLHLEPALATDTVLK